MAKKQSLEALKKALASRYAPSKKSALITELSAGIPKKKGSKLLEDALDGAAPLVQVAIMDGLHELTGTEAYQQPLEDMLGQAASMGDDGEELYIATRLALGRVNGLGKDAMDEWGDSGIAITAVRTTRGAARGATRGAVKPKHRSSITIIIHGTWAADGKWWRPKGDFYNYLKKDLKLADLYGGSDRFKWSGKNRGSSRRKAATSLTQWIKAHPADQVNVFAHSHGANVAMLATRKSTRIHRLVMLSPPVREDYYADWRKVGQAYNIQANFDPVVAIARGGQWFKIPQVKEKKLKANGHSSSHDPDVWKKEKLAKFIGIPWR